jgi:hypothetical protein
VPFIGTTELEGVALNGTVHSLSGSDHFQQRGWYLTDLNGGAWQYLPELRSRAQSASKAERSNIKHTFKKLANENQRIGTVIAESTKRTVSKLTNGALSLLGLVVNARD